MWFRFPITPLAIAEAPGLGSLAYGNALQRESTDAVMFHIMHLLLIRPLKRLSCNIQPLAVSTAAAPNQLWQWSMSKLVHQLLWLSF